MKKFLAIWIGILFSPLCMAQTDPIVIRAMGIMGGENLELRLDGNPAAAWTMSTGYQNYTAAGSGAVQVHFTNDDQAENGMDIQVDYIDYHGTILQAEAQVINTAVYQDNSCGGSYSEMMHCNGYIEFDTSSLPTVSGLPGDVNNDKAVNIVDALMTAQYYVGLSPPDFDAGRADVDCNGAVNIVDALQMAQYYVGLISVFPCPLSTPTPVIQTPTPGQGSTFNVFLLLGQSNMAGYPKAQAADRAEDDRIRVLGFDNCSATDRRENQWDVASPPLHGCRYDALGPGDWFAKTIIDYLPGGDTIGLIPCAISGERIETFLKNGGSRYNWIIDRARIAQQAGGIIKGILFHQGESNNGDTSWPGKVNTLVEDLRNDLDIGPVPFIAGELLYSGGCAGHNVQVNKLPGIVSNCSVVSAEGLVVDPADTQWNLHFGHDSVVTLGKRYAQAMIQALGL